MIRFNILDDAAASLDLSGAYLVGADGVPIRAEIERVGDEIRCNKRVQGPAALSLLYPVGAFGAIMLETTRLVERDAPYILTVELARGRLMRISQKREDWGLFDYPGGDELYARVDSARARFIEALTADAAVVASRKGREALCLAVECGEALSLFHSGVFLERRRAANQFGARPLGCGVSLTQRDDAYTGRLNDAFDFVTVPLTWRTIEPKQGVAAWDAIDPWLVWAGRQKPRMAVRGTPLISFYKSDLPDWVFLYEQDYEAIRDLVQTHVKRTVQRLAAHVHLWDVVSGLHAHNTFNFSFEQIMELTRLGASLVKQIAPKSTSILDLVAPWGEYYARNPRTIPPMLFADMAVQSGIPFDAFGLQFYFGVPQDGMFVRDMMQVSAMVDRFANLGKPLHISAVAVPSAMTRDANDHWHGAAEPAKAGQWHAPWSEALQAEWLRHFHAVVLSKPFVETVTWRDLADVDGHYLPHGGLLRPDLTPKPAYDELLKIRAELFPGRGRGGR